MYVNVKSESNFNYENEKGKWKQKNGFLTAISILAFCTFILGATLLDSVSIIPFIMCIVSLLWLVTFCIANKIIQL